MDDLARVLATQARAMYGALLVFYLRAYYERRATMAGQPFTSDQVMVYVRAAMAHNAEYHADADLALSLRADGALYCDPCGRVIMDVIPLGVPSTDAEQWTHEHFCPQCGMYWSHDVNACGAPTVADCPRAQHHPAREAEARRLADHHRAADRVRYGY